MRIFLAILFSCFLITSVQAESIDYSVWADVLSTHVDKRGFVDYQGLKDNSAKLNQFIQYIENVSFEGLSDVEQKTFWINAYNALTIKRMVEAYPTKTIRLLDFGLVWKRKKKVAGEKYSLEHIEHKILRPLGDARIHFAINCASIGCPRLANKPFYPDTLDQQLDVETKRFINDHEKVYLERGENTLYHSEIFSWFEEDFLVGSASVKEYIFKYINDDDKKFMATNDVAVDTIPYDWGINDQKPRK